MRRSLSTCAHRRCPTLTADTYCEAHYKARRQASDQQRPTSRARGYDTKWQRTRRAYLSMHPLCQWHEGCISQATDVHHLDGLGPIGLHGHDEDNLQALCHAHHSQVTATEQKGGWNA